MLKITVKNRRLTTKSLKIKLVKFKISSNLNIFIAAVDS